MTELPKFPNWDPCFDESDYEYAFRYQVKHKVRLAPHLLNSLRGVKTYANCPNSRGDLAFAPGEPYRP